MATRQRHDPTKNLVGFGVGDVLYAVSIYGVREICNPLPVVALPRAPHSVRGVADFRNEVVAVIDLRERFGLPPLVMVNTASSFARSWLGLRPFRSFNTRL